ncbi:hypothetical protein CY652_10960 [Burkholderia sp. WAC0059]|uniref:hypothetical protein n=1 Tax=Burkholderia sp. WAC0059 TaxID=2066022 RepID=UPI000C7EC37B|nr:hypothetical protein [Burkholderia sp. WAC0059]PLZ02253.1 hypothetical protein CY652_10960 [Burkholderia sp. WAC0059]
MGQWVLGAGLAAAVALAHAHSSPVSSHAGFERVQVRSEAREMGRPALPHGSAAARWYGARHAGARGAYGDDAGRRAIRDSGMAAGYDGIRPVSAEARPDEHLPVDSPLRAGSIREDVARFSAEHSGWRSFAPTGNDGSRAPMPPSPYRN